MKAIIISEKALTKIIDDTLFGMHQLWTEFKARPSRDGIDLNLLYKQACKKIQKIGDKIKEL